MSCHQSFNKAKVQALSRLRLLRVQYEFRMEYSDVRNPGAPIGLPVKFE